MHSKKIVETDKLHFYSKILTSDVKVGVFHKKKKKKKKKKIRAVAGQRARLLLTFVKHKAKPIMLIHLFALMQ